GLLGEGFFGFEGVFLDFMQWFPVESLSRSLGRKGWRSCWQKLGRNASEVFGMQEDLALKNQSKVSFNDRAVYVQVCSVDPSKTRCPLKLYGASVSGDTLLSLSPS